jgi:hypothetical protein
MIGTRQQQPIRSYYTGWLPFKNYLSLLIIKSLTRIDIAEDQKALAGGVGPWGLSFATQIYSPFSLSSNGLPFPDRDK